MRGSQFNNTHLIMSEITGNQFNNTYLMMSEITGNQFNNTYLIMSEITGNQFNNIYLIMSVIPGNRCNNKCWIMSEITGIPLSNTYLIETCMKFLSVLFHWNFHWNPNVLQHRMIVVGCKGLVILWLINLTHLIGKRDNRWICTQLDCIICTISEVYLQSTVAPH